MGLISGLKDAGINLFLNSDKTLGFVNDKIGRYAHVQSIKKDGVSFEFIALPVGTNDTVIAKVGKITIADDSSYVTLHDVSANIEWVNNLLADFVEGKNIPIPEDKREIVGQAKKFL